MLFNAWIFPAFLAIVLALYRLLGTRGQNALLVVASYVFYGWWDAIYRAVGAVDGR